MSERRLPQRLALAASAHSGRLSVLAGFVILGLLHMGWLSEWLENAGRDGWYTDDARNLLGFFAYAEPEAFRDDLIGAYSRAQSPFAHHLLVAAFAKLGYLRELTQYGPALVWTLTVILAARCGAILGRFPGAVLAATLVLAVPVYPERVSGLLSRALCFPCVFWFTEGLLRSKPKVSAAAVITCAAFYPTVGAALGFGLVLWLVVFPKPTGARGPRLRRLKVVAATGGLAVLILLPTLWGLSRFGATTSHEDWSAYPEAGPRGIAGPGDRWPWRGVLEELHVVQRGLVDDRPFWTAPRRALGATLFDDTVLYGALGLCLLRARRDRRARRLLLLGLTALFAHWVTRLFYPWMYAPTRALQYLWPPFFHLSLVAGGQELGLRGARVTARVLRAARASHESSSTLRSLVRRAATLLPSAVRLGVFALILSTASGHGNPQSGFVFRRSDGQLSLERYVAGLGPETHVAGWPDDPMSNLGWVSGRQVFMTGEMHIPHHKDYLDQLRPRLFDFFSAYLAHEPKDVLAFADKYRVTHFLIDTRHFGNRPPGYMPPFAAKIVKRHHEGRRRGGFALHRLASQLTVATQGPFRLVSIAKLREHEAAGAPN